MADFDIREHINGLIDEEHRLRGQVERGELAPGEERERLRQLEAQLDQCWDLLRQRRAQREFGNDPAAATPRPLGQVENYRQ